MSHPTEIPISLWPSEIEALADWHREQARLAAVRENYASAAEHKKRGDDLLAKMRAAWHAHLNPTNASPPS